MLVVGGLDGFSRRAPFGHADHGEQWRTFLPASAMVRVMLSSGVHGAAR
jgi:hypothetical protein